MNQDMIFLTVVGIAIILAVFYAIFINSVKKRTTVDLIIISLMIIISCLFRASYTAWSIIGFYFLIIVIVDVGGYILEFLRNLLVKKFSKLSNIFPANEPIFFAEDYIGQSMKMRYYMIIFIIVTIFVKFF